MYWYILLCGCYKCLEMNFLNSVIDFSSVIAHIVDTMTVSFYEAIFLSRRYMDSQYILFSILQILSFLAAVIALVLLV